MKTRYKGGYRFKKEGYYWHLYLGTTLLGHIAHDNRTKRWGFNQLIGYHNVISVSPLRYIADFIDQLNKEKK
jgi:hypothetical protein